MKSLRTIKIILILVLLAVAVSAQPAAAQGVNQLPGDRVIVFCQSTTLEVWGATNTGSGVFLASFFYGDLLATGSLTRFTNVGQVRVSVDLLGNFLAVWLGGPYNASGVGDFAKAFQCPGQFTVYSDLLRASNPGFGNPYVAGGYASGYVAPGVITIDPITGLATNSSTTQSGIQQIAVITGSPGAVVNQSAGINAPVAGCGTRVYVIQSGDTLFRISRRFGTSVSALAACNGIITPSRIFVGQQIFVP